MRLIFQCAYVCESGEVFIFLLVIRSKMSGEERSNLEVHHFKLDFEVLPCIFTRSLVKNGGKPVGRQESGSKRVWR